MEKMKGMREENAQESENSRNKNKIKRKRKA